MIFAMAIASIAFIMACGKSDVQHADNIEAIRPISDTVLTYSQEGAAPEIEIVEYQYEKPEDLFWSKAIYKNADGTAGRSIVRELDPATRLPIKEYSVDEFGETDYYHVLKYEANTNLLTQKEVYAKSVAPENKTEEFLYTYQDGVLITQTKREFSTDKSYKNVDGNNIVSEYTQRYLPNMKYRNKGLIETFARTEKSKMYCTAEMIKDYEIKGAKPGDIYYTEETVFDQNGYPVTYNSTDPSAGEEHRFSKEYYEVKLDEKGRITELIPYKNKEKDSIAKNALMWKFFYNNDGTIEKVEEFMKNDKTGKYKLIHGRDRYQYFNPVPAMPFLSDASNINEHFCQHRQVYSKTETIIEKYDNKEKIVIYKTASMDGGFPDKELPGQMSKKVITKFEKVKIK